MDASLWTTESLGATSIGSRQLASLGHGLHEACIDGGNAGW